jgi:hypothetical protein
MGRKRGLRLVVLALVVGSVGFWGIRARRASGVDRGEPWPVPRPARMPRQETTAPPERSAVPPSEPRPPVATATPATPTTVVDPAPLPAVADIEPEPDAVPPSPAPRPRAPRAAARPPAGAAAPRTDGSAPGPEYTIKGNAGSRLFHGPDSPYYGRTKAEVWFRTPEDARAAGFTAWTPKRRTSS